MRTKIRTLITVCVFGFIGVLTVSAKENLDEKNSAAGNNKFNFSTESEVAANEMVDYQKEAQLIIRQVADMAEAKAKQQIIGESEALTINENVREAEVSDENNETVIDLNAESQLMLKVTADNEETKAIQKLVEEGRFSENK
jgi:hypothetical protein